MHWFDERFSSVGLIGCRVHDQAKVAIFATAGCSFDRHCVIVELFAKAIGGRNGWPFGDGREFRMGKSEGCR